MKLSPRLARILALIHQWAREFNLDVERQPNPQKLTPSSVPYIAQILTFLRNTQQIARKLKKPLLPHQTRNSSGFLGFFGFGDLCHISCNLTQ